MITPESRKTLLQKYLAVQSYAEWPQSMLRFVITRTLIEREVPALQYIYCDEKVLHLQHWQTRLK